MNEMVCNTQTRPMIDFLFRLGESGQIKNNRPIKIRP